MTRRIYLDHNASTPLDPLVSTYLATLLQELEGNPSSIHTPGQKMRSLIHQSRATIASFLDCRPQEILFTSGGTENANMVLRSISQQKSPQHLITSSVEHSCIYATAKFLESQGLPVTFLYPEAWGAVTADAVKAAIRPDTTLIALTAVNNETGVKTDIEAIARIAQEHQIPFFVDAVALMGKELFKIPPGVSFLGFSGHKFHAPQGIGALFMRSGQKIMPWLLGGEQEFGRRAGTENVLGIAGLAKAVERLKTELPRATERMRMLRDRFEFRLKEAFPTILINGEGTRIVNTSNIAFPDIDGESLLMALDQAGIAASHGSACASGSLEPSRVLLNMGLPLTRVRSSLRFSLSRFTTEEEIDRACHIIIKKLSSEG